MAAVAVVGVLGGWYLLDTSWQNIKKYLESGTVGDLTGGSPPPSNESSSESSTGGGFTLPSCRSLSELGSELF
jgi:hypothetical protein